jgi:hypothetical protein
MRRAREPVNLVQVLFGLKYKPNWSFRIVPYKLGWKMYCDHQTTHSETGGPTIVHHGMVVPDQPRWGVITWRRWVFDQLILCETHEAGEFFSVNGVKPFAPQHGSAVNPYVIEERHDTQGE